MNGTAPSFHIALQGRGRRARSTERTGGLGSGLDFFERHACPREVVAQRKRIARDPLHLLRADPSSRPPALEPVSSVDRNMLKWLMTAGAVVSVVRTTDESGTISPFDGRACATDWRSVGCARNC